MLGKFNLGVEYYPFEWAGITVSWQNKYYKFFDNPEEQFESHKNFKMPVKNVINVGINLTF